MSTPGVGFFQKEKINQFFTQYSQIRRERKIYWWLEIFAIGVFYSVYAFIRNQFGSTSDSVSPQDALDNALILIDFEKYLGLYQEARIQGWFLDYEWFLWIFNVFYGLFHFAVTICVFIWLYIRFPWDFARLRTAGLITTGLGLVGFALFPVMPPRLLGDAGIYGGRLLNSPFVDTLREIGGLWSFDSGTLQRISNQYAAMPSIHIAWAIWSAYIIYTRAKNPYVKILAALYPFVTLFAVVVTANHYWIDALGGVAVVVVAFLVANWIHEAFAKRKLHALSKIIPTK